MTVSPRPTSALLVSYDRLNLTNVDRTRPPKRAAPEKIFWIHRWQVPQTGNDRWWEWYEHGHTGFGAAKKKSAAMIQTPTLEDDGVLDGQTTPAHQ